jgi:hypothetical protein
LAKEKAAAFWRLWNVGARFALGLTGIASDAVQAATCGMIALRPDGSK